MENEKWCISKKEVKETKNLKGRYLKYNNLEYYDEMEHKIWRDNKIWKCKKRYRRDNSINKLIKANYESIKNSEYSESKIY